MRIRTVLAELLALGLLAGVLGIVASSAPALADDPPGVTISGTLYNDLDSDGVHDPGERGIAHISVATLNHPVIGYTDADGQFALTFQEAGEYDVYANGGDLGTLGYTPTTAQIVHVTVPAEGLAGVDFGYRNPNPPVDGRVSGTIFNDRNGDGDQDAGEPGIPNITLVVGDRPEQAVTDADGHYAIDFENALGVDIFASGQQLTTLGYLPTTANPVHLTVVEGETAGVDFGWRIPSDIPMSGTVWDDLDADGVRDPGEPGLAGVEVRATSQAAVRTDADGRYTFTVHGDGGYDVFPWGVAITYPGYTHTTLELVNVTVDESGIDGVDFGYRATTPPVAEVTMTITGALGSDTTVNPGGGGTTNDGTLTFAGQGEPGQTITVTGVMHGDDDPPVELGEAEVGENGDWELTAEVDDCHWDFEATQTDGDQHVTGGAGGGGLWLVDSTAPTIVITGVSDGSIIEGVGGSAGIEVVDLTPDGEGGQHVADGVDTTITLNGQPYVSGTPITQPGEYELVVTTRDRLGNRRVQTVRFTCVHATRLSYSGASSSDYHDTGRFSATLVDSDDPTNPLGGVDVVFTMGTQQCPAITDDTGLAICSITPIVPVGTYPVTVAYGGDGRYRPTSATATFRVTHEQTTIRYTGDTDFVNGSGGHLGGILLEDDLVPITGRTVTLVLGTGPTAQTCTDVTDVNGAADCTIADVEQPLGAGQVSATFDGDEYYQSARDVDPILVAAFSGAGHFVVGDETVGPLSGAVGRPVNFWGAQWAPNNALSGGSAPSAFKGFEDNAVPPACGTGWTAHPGNAGKPPSTVPEYLAVIVSGRITKSGSVIAGDVRHIVIVRTNAGYAGNPGHAGTGRIVSVVC